MDKVKKRRGRPPVRASASEAALAGIDPTSCDPKRVLQEIALDRSAPHAARVMAAKALLRTSTIISTPDRSITLDRVSARAIEMLGRGRVN